MDGHEPVTAVVGDDGRGRPGTSADEPTTSLAMDRETFVLLAGGRRAAAPGNVRVSGDTTLGDRVVASMAVTP